MDFRAIHSKKPALSRIMEIKIKRTKARVAS